jgi:N-acyl-D-amino-acid deacylase
MEPLPPTAVDLLVLGGTVVDGTGRAPFAADIGIVEGRIVALGDLRAMPAGRRIDASGAVVTPGFIDIHTHSDLSLLYTRDMTSSLAQGVTCEVVGNCGFSLGLATRDPVFALERRNLDRFGVALDWGSLAGFLRRIEDDGIAIHVATLAGHGTLRKRVMGLDARTPTSGELAAMERALDDALDAGAVGLSSGLEYVPGMYADVAELTALARRVALRGGFYATHLRDEGDFLEQSVAEAIAVAQGAGIALQLSHHKAERRPNWGKVVRTLAQVDAAQARGTDILLDQYPYTAYQTSLATIALPPWAVAGTPQALADRLQDPSFRERVRAAMATTQIDWQAVAVASHPSRPELVGVPLAAAARAAGEAIEVFVLDVLSDGSGWISAVHFAMSEDDVEHVLRDSRVMIGSDAVAMAPDGPAAADRPHPRTYGTFARVLGRYVRERSVLSLPEAIRRMTTLPARRLGWSDRGIVAAGAAADLVVLDPATVADRATFAAPHGCAAGVRTVIVAGRVAFEGGMVQPVRAGKVLRHEKS